MTVEILGLEDMIPPELLEYFSVDVVNSILADIADGARNEWIRLAGEALFTTRRDYLNGIQKVQMKPSQAIISLVGVLPNILEHDQSAYDMHDTLLGPDVPVVPMGSRGKHEKEDGDGYYRAIPFRHGTPTSGGATGTPMGRAYGKSDAVADAMALGKKVYGEAKKLRPRESMPGEGMSWGEEEFEGQQKRLRSGLAPKLKKRHAVDIYAGMVRERKTYKSATQSQYITFRSISTGSPGWQRRATRGLNLSERVAQYVAKTAPQAFAAYAEGLK